MVGYAPAAFNAPLAKEPVVALPKLEIHPEIARAETPPGWLYAEPEVLARQRATLFARAWEPVVNTDPPREPESAAPFVFQPGVLDEPLVLTRDAGGALRALSNVCTHRANLVAAEPCHARELRCRYHGRRFALDGTFRFMPEFDGAADFPRAADNLPAAQCAEWGGFVFAALPGAPDFATVFRPVMDRLAFLDVARMVVDPEARRDYTVHANWALYCENFLEGFHIPYVHPALHRELEFAQYRTELFPHGSLQIGAAREEESAFALPPDHPDAAHRVAGYYFFVFPNLMFNFYPWGLSLNIVRPLDVETTVVSYYAFVADPAKRDCGAGAGLHTVELEDEGVVESVQQGIRSRLYTRGRYSPTQERAVHHFHRHMAALAG